MWWNLTPHGKKWQFAPWGTAGVVTDGVLAKCIFVNVGDLNRRGWRPQWYPIRRNLKCISGGKEVGDAHSSDDRWDNITHQERRGIASDKIFEERSIFQLTKDSNQKGIRSARLSEKAISKSQAGQKFRERVSFIAIKHLNTLWHDASECF